MRFLTLAVLCLGANLLAQTTKSDRYKYSPFLATAKLWNEVRYLHPRLSGDSTSWDNALIAAIPHLEEVRSDEELAVVLDNMLATLHDPCTRIIAGLPGKGQSAQSLDEETLVIQPGTGTFAGALGASLMLRSGLARANTIVWDLRGTRMAPLQGRVSPRSVLLSGIGISYREHSGHPPQDGNDVATYHSSFVAIEPSRLPLPKTASNGPREVYLVDKNSAVPAKAIIEQLNAQTAIISEDEPSAMQAGLTALVPLLGDVAAEVRVAELRYPDGTTEFAPNRVVLNRGKEAAKAAANLINSTAWGLPGSRPKFELTTAGFHDMPYSENPYPSRELRILAAIRIWGIFHYFHPHVPTLGEKWDDVLIEFVPKVADAKDALSYHLAIAAMVSRVNDVHAIAISPETAKVFGTGNAPFELRFVEDQFVVTQLYRSSPAQVGDVLLKIDGKPVVERVGELSAFLKAPQPLASMNLISQLLLPSLPNRETRLTVKRGGAEKEFAIAPSAPAQKVLPHRLGSPIRVLDGNLGYADLEQIDDAQVEELFGKLHDTKALILDLRGFPRASAQAIAARLGTREQPVAVEFVRNVVAPGLSPNNDITFSRSSFSVPRSSGTRYTGKVVALIDDIALTGAQDSALFIKAAADPVLIGLPTSGGFSNDVTRFTVPGGIRISFSGQSIQLPGGKSIDETGLRPDIVVNPTLAAIVAGRDEILDRAIQYLSAK